MVRVTAFLLLQLTYLVPHRAADDVVLHKCCGVNEMLSGDGRACVQAAWPRPSLSPAPGVAASRLLDGTWLRRWLPPGLPLDSISNVCLLQNASDDDSFESYDTFCRRDVASSDLMKNAPIILSVKGSSAWDSNLPLHEDLWKSQVVFIGKHEIARPKPGGGHRNTSMYCVDAAPPPLGPFVLLFKTLCSQDDCVFKCCEDGEVLVQKDESWKCGSDSRGHWSPMNSSFKDHEMPYTYSAAYMDTHFRRLVVSGERHDFIATRGSMHFQFSTWVVCSDYKRHNNRTFEEVLLFREHSRITRGVYWMLRPLTFVSMFLLVVALYSMAFNVRLRMTLYGWSLVSYAVCLLVFNMGQFIYYVTISDTIDSSLGVPDDLHFTCENFAFFMYFILIAAHSWLTAVCLIMALPYRLPAWRLCLPRHAVRKKDFLKASAFVWSITGLLISACVAVYKNAVPHGTASELYESWYRPTFIETRTCFDEIAQVNKEGDVPQFVMQKFGAAQFFYGPVGALVIVNIFCVIYTLKKVRHLRRGNSLLRREEDERSHGDGQLETENDQAAGGATRSLCEWRRVCCEIEWVTVRMFLLTGAIEYTAEVISWATIQVTTQDLYALHDSDLHFRATGYVVDLLRAACVARLAAPEKGYINTLRRWLAAQGERWRGAGREELGEGGRGRRNMTQSAV